jgi:low temperature requirement protein LtrA
LPDDEGRAHNVRGSTGTVERQEPEEVIQSVRVLCSYCLPLALLLIIGLAIALAIAGHMEAHLPLIVGLILLAVGVALAFALTHHNPLQRQVILALISLGGSAVATEAITGALEVNLTLGAKTAITASGALAVFIVMYFFSARKPTE